jgi:hypothetical protein
MIDVRQHWPLPPGRVYHVLLAAPARDDRARRRDRQEQGTRFAPHSGAPEFGNARSTR